MIKALSRILKQDRERMNIPRSVQQVIPVKRIWLDGIWLVGNKYSKCWRFTDINYAIASKDDKTSMFLDYSELLNALDSNATTKITVCNKRMNKQAFEESILLPLQGDQYDGYRKEYNDMLLDKVTDVSNSIVQERYVTVSVAVKDIDEARSYFNRVGADLSSHLSQLSSFCEELDSVERFRIFHDFFRAGEEVSFSMNLKQMIRQGRSFRDYICPDTFEFSKDCFKMGKTHGRVLFLKDYASYIKDSLVAELCELNRNLFFSIDIIPIPTDEAVREVENKLLGVETNITNWQRKQNQNNNFSAVIPYDLEQQRKEAKEFLDDLTTRDQRMMFAVVTLVHIADTLEQLNADTETLRTIGREHSCHFATLYYQQEDGLNTVLPYGLRRIKALRTLTTESTAVLMPFRAQEIQDAGGICYGVNAVSKNLLICNRKRLISPHAFYLGVSGSGKSVGMKNTVASIALSTHDDIIIIDAEREYGDLVRALGGEIIEISPSSPHHINPLELGEGYDADENPIAVKAEVITSILEQQMGAGTLTGSHKSIIDRCTANVYRPYLKSRGKRPAPLLTDWRNEVMRQVDPEAREIALAAELITEGSLNVFAHAGNVNMDSRIIALDLYEMGEQLRPTALVVTLEAIQNRVAANRKRGKFTWVFIDECYLYFKYKYSADVLYRAWKRWRKYGAPLTAATQNVEECLKSETARLMLANSEFLLLFNQAATDRAELGKLLRLSDTQMGYVTNVEAGHGLLRMGGALVPFVNTIPKDTELYRLMTTTPNEKF